MPVLLYGFMSSPHLRSTMMTCEALGVEYEVKEVDPMRLQHRKPEFLKMNPLHSIPTMTDGDYVLFDSHAISAYLANKYGKDDKWYPKEPRLRGIVDQRLHFHNSVIAVAFKNMAVPLLFGRAPQPKAVAMVKEAVRNLDKLLGDSEFVAHSWPTIADCHCSSTVLSIEAMLPAAVPARVAAWLRRCERALPGHHKVHGSAVQLMEAMRPRLDGVAGEPSKL